MNKIRGYKGVLVVGAIIIVFASVFYWYEFRPYIVRKECNKEALKMAIQSKLNNKDSNNSYNEFYVICLRSYGF